METNHVESSRERSSAPSSASSASTGGSAVQLKEQVRGQDFATQERQLTPREDKGGSTGASAGGGAIQMRAAVQREETPGVYSEQNNVGQGGMTVQGPQTGRQSTSAGYSTQAGGTASLTREWQIWPAPGSPPIPPIPIAAVPGMFVTWTPSVKASVGAQFQGVQAGARSVQAAVAVTGSLLGGIEYGVPPAASLYLRFGPTVQAQAQATLDSQGLKEADATITLDAAITVGAQAGSGQIDYGVTLSRSNIGRFIGFRFERGQPTRYGTFEPGRPLLDAIDWARRAARRANELYEQATAPFRRMYSSLSSAIEGLYGVP